MGSDLAGFTNSLVKPPFRDTFITRRIGRKTQRKLQKERKLQLRTVAGFGGSNVEGRVRDDRGVRLVD